MRGAQTGASDYHMESRETPRRDNEVLASLRGDPPSIQALVTSFARSKEDGSTRYRITLLRAASTLESGNMVISECTRRFSEFLSLHTQMVRCDRVDPPPFMASRCWFHTDRVRHRRAALLEQYVDSLLARSLVAGLPTELANFLGIGEKLQGVTSAAFERPQSLWLLSSHDPPNAGRLVAVGARLQEAASECAKAAALVQHAQRLARAGHAPGTDSQLDLHDLVAAFCSASTATDEAVRMLDDARHTSRSTHLRPLSDLIPRPPPWRTWEAEWIELSVEHHRLTGTLRDAAWVSRYESIEKLAATTSQCAPVAAGWSREDSLAFQCLQMRRPPLARAVLRGEERFAASVYTLATILARQAARQRAAGSTNMPPVLYKNLRGLHSLEGSDQRWELLERCEADETGFIGFSCASLVTAACRPECFVEAGYAASTSQYALRDDVYLPQDSPVVAFESAAEDAFGLHEAIALSDTVGAFPPNTLFRLRRIDRQGFTAPNGVFVRQPLITVSATYRAPLGPGHGICAKLCSSATSLMYGDSLAYARGLDDALQAPPLTIEQECSREMDFTDWAGQCFNLASEWRYVCGISGQLPGRDRGHAGKTPADFLAQANERIRARREVQLREAQAAQENDDGAQSLLAPCRLREEHAYLTREEVLAVRLYTGPAYQPINDFLRQLARLDGAHRIALARHPKLTFAATVRHLCACIRKLAAAATAEQLSAPSYRGVRGSLDPSFWRPDPRFGKITAVEPAFMSSSRSRSAPVVYMLDESPNVLWELCPAPETDSAYHCGAEIGLLSQFPSEDEVLYPPCCMLVVCDEACEQGKGPPASQASTEQGKSYISVKARPCFI